jgi:hypothetical protein
MPSILPPARDEKIARAIGYFFVSVVGFSVLIRFPAESSTVDALNARGGNAGSILTVVWGLFMATSLAAVPVTLMERYRAEFILLPLFGSALAVALFSAWARLGDDPLVLPRAAASTALLCFLVARFFSLRRVVRYTKEPGWKTGTWTPLHGRS